MAEAVAALAYGTFEPEGARRYLNAVLDGRTHELTRLNGKYFKQSGHMVDLDVDGRNIIKGKPNKLNVI